MECKHYHSTVETMGRFIMVNCIDCGDRHVREAKNGFEVSKVKRLKEMVHK